VGVEYREERGIFQFSRNIGGEKSRNFDGVVDGLPQTKVDVG